MSPFPNSRLLLAGLMGLALSGCQIWTSIEEVAQQNAALEQPAVSTDRLRAADPQAKLGAAQHERVVAENGGIYSNPALERELALVTGQLVAAGNDDGADASVFEVTLLDSPTVNAFALPGGYLYITRGLLALASDTAEVAAVLAHEMAHVSAAHGVARASQAQAGDLVEEVLNGVITSDRVGAVAAAQSRQRMAAFSRAQELQADALGIRRMGRAGYDTFAAPRFLEALERFTAWQEGAGAGDGFEGATFNASHPSTPERVEVARRHARTFGPAGTGTVGRELHLKAIDGAEFGDAASEGFVRGQRFLHPRLGFAFEVPAGFVLENRADAVLATGPGGAALRFDAVDAEPGVDVADYLDSGWVNGLDASTIRQSSVPAGPAATGQAQAGDFDFTVTVVLRGARIYRFILAQSRGAGEDAAGLSVPRSFRNLTAAEEASLAPLKLKIVTVRPGDTVDRLAAGMGDVARPAELLRALNGLGAGEQPRPGEGFKLVVE